MRKKWHNHWNELLHDLLFGMIFTAQRIGTQGFLTWQTLIISICPLTIPGWGGGWPCWGWWCQGGGRGWCWEWWCGGGGRWWYWGGGGPITRPPSVDTLCGKLTLLFCSILLHLLFRNIPQHQLSSFSSASSTWSSSTSLPSSFSTSSSSTSSSATSSSSTSSSGPYCLDLSDLSTLFSPFTVFDLTWGYVGWVLAGMAKCNSGTSSGISSGIVQKPFQSHDSASSSTAQGGGGSFKNGKPIGEVSWCDAKNGRANPLMDWKVVECFSRSVSLSLFLSVSLFRHLSTERPF